MVASSAELMATPQRVPPPRQPTPQMSAVNRRSAASPGAKLPFVSCTEASSDLPTGKKMNSSSSIAMTTTIVAIVGSPLNAPARATARASTTVRSDNAIAAPKPNDGPFVPAMKPCANPQPTPSTAAIVAPLSLPNVASASAASDATMTGPSAHAAANAGHFGCVPDKAHVSAAGVSRPPHGTKVSASSAAAASSGVVRSRDVGMKTTGARGGAAAGVAILLVVPAQAGTQCLTARKSLDPGFRRDDSLLTSARHLGSVDTSLSHFSSSRLRSADEPYFTKS